MTLAKQMIKLIISLSDENFAVWIVRKRLKKATSRFCIEVRYLRSFAALIVYISVILIKGDLNNSLFLEITLSSVVQALLSQASGETVERLPKLYKKWRQLTVETKVQVKLLVILLGGFVIPSFFL